MNGSGLFGRLAAMLLTLGLCAGCGAARDLDDGARSPADGAQSPASQLASAAPSDPETGGAQSPDEPMVEEWITGEDQHIEQAQGGGAGSKEQTGEAEAFDGGAVQVEPDDPDEMEDVTITVVDLQGEPVLNLVINLEYVGGHEGAYMPGDALTWLDGSAVRGASPARYNVVVTDRRQLDYTGTTLRNQMVFSMVVERGAAKGAPA